MGRIAIPLIVAFLMGSRGLAFAQQQKVEAKDFEFGDVTPKELAMKAYDRDSTAEAVVINEHGRAEFDDEYKLIYTYHVKIKILNKEGFKYANVSIPLYKEGSDGETVNHIKGATYNLNEDSAGVIQSSFLDKKKIFKETVSALGYVIKFTLPDIKNGSLIEYTYTVTTPYTNNFHAWEFQSEIPKIYSQYDALVPANYEYHASLKGYHKLDVYKASVVEHCFNPPGTQGANCSLLIFGMKDIPAFHEEEYMTSKQNFLSRVEFELAAVHYFNGSSKQISMKWQDEDKYLRGHEEFGLQISKGKNFYRKVFDSIVSGKDSDLAKAKKIFYAVKYRIKLNDLYGTFTDKGLKKAWEGRSGNVADINLSLLVALRVAGLDADPVILSTRAHGLPKDIYPVVRDFNYVVVRAKIKGVEHLLDATDPDMPFGMIREECFNGKGRLIHDKEASSWLPLVPSLSHRSQSVVDAALAAEGQITGTYKIYSYGYEAYDKRRAIKNYATKEDYVATLKEKMPSLKISHFEINNLNDIDEPLEESYAIEMKSSFSGNVGIIYFNPFFGGFNKNPFKLKERSYPVDFGIPYDYRYLTRIVLPEGCKITSMPKSAGYTIADKSTKYLLNVDDSDGQFSLAENVIIKKTFFDPDEYLDLKALFSKMISVRNTRIVIQKTK